MPMIRDDELDVIAEHCGHAFKKLRDIITAIVSRPVAMLLYCPRCLNQHIDAPEPATGWTNPPHKTHKCHSCGHLWRPADDFTTGVAHLQGAMFDEDEGNPGHANPGFYRNRNAA